MVQMAKRQCAAEWSKLASLRSTWLILPCAVVVGIVASLVMCGQAVLAQKVLGGSIRQWEPIQVAHWIRMMTCTLFALWAIGSVTGEYRVGTMPLSYRASRNAGVLLTAKWLVTGVVSAFLSGVTMMVAIGADKLLFSSVAGSWNFTSSDVLHLLWAIPVYSFLMCGLGVGLGALFRTASAAVGIMLLWEFVLEPFSVILPHGSKAFALLPFNNGAVFIGEETQFPLPVEGWQMAGLLLVVWVVMACAGGWYRVQKRYA
ncbi:ABC transporter permease subunit [Corynebacterium kroppenstedtii]|uniref:ABC transporter permease subunit n=1 Tax=Corynebacterium sp. PCR 32 TaxID=3351342 RepID=UPI0030A4AC16